MRINHDISKLVIDFCWEEFNKKARSIQLNNKEYNIPIGYVEQDN